MRRIAIDMDDVLADTLAALVEWFRVTYGYRFTRSDLVGKEFEDVASPEHVRALSALLVEGSIFGDLPVMPGAVEVVRALAGRDEVFVVSAATQFPGSFLPKFRWLERHFPFIPATHVVFCGDKAIVDADYLIDDNVHKFPRFKGRGILFDTPHNADVTGYTRVASWAEVARLLLEGAPRA